MASAAERIHYAQFAADKGLVDLNEAALTAEGSEIARTDRFADTMSQEPSGLIGHLKPAVQPMGVDALLAALHEIRRLEHFVQPGATLFENGTDLPVTNRRAIAISYCRRPCLRPSPQL